MTVIDDIRNLGVDIRWRRTELPSGPELFARGVRPAIGPLAGCLVDADVDASSDIATGWLRWHATLMIEPPTARGAGWLQVAVSENGEPWPTAQTCQHQITRLLLGRPSAQMMWQPAHAVQRDSWHALCVLPCLWDRQIVTRGHRDLLDQCR